MNSSRQLIRLLRPQVSARLALLRPEKLPNVICWGPGQAASAPARRFNTAQRSLDVGKASDWAPQKYTVDHFYDLSGVRSLIRVSGPDTLKFINGLCTSFLDDKDPSSSQKGPIDGFYTSFLKPQGRVFFDAFIYYPLDPSGSQGGVPELLLDVASEMKDQALLHLTRYRLLSKVKIEDVSEAFSVISLAGPEVFAQFGGPTEGGSLTAAHAKKLGASYASWDHRFRSAELGVRLVMSTENKAITLNATELPSSDYELKMLRLGIGETPRGILPLVSLPMECNIELLNGIHFRKGCYVGQELTIRTHHKGVIRKRLMPARLVAPHLPTSGMAPLTGADLFLPGEAKRKAIGKVTWAVGQHALVLMRLEALPTPPSKQLVCEFESDGASHTTTLEFSYPPWIRSELSQA